jgi:hypothetical protein
VKETKEARAYMRVADTGQQLHKDSKASGLGRCTVPEGHLGGAQTVRESDSESHGEEREHIHKARATPNESELSPSNGMV